MTRSGTAGARERSHKFGGVAASVLLRAPTPPRNGLRQPLFDPIPDTHTSMKRLLLALGFVLLPITWLAAQDLTTEERKRAADYLEKTRDAFLASTDGLSEAQWNFKPSPTRWSVAEVAEHIAATEDMLMGTVHDKVMIAPARTEPTDVKEIDEFVVKAISDRTGKVKAPEPLVPTRRFGSPADTLRHFKESRAKTLAFLDETKDLRGHAIDSPLGKKLDGYQWLLFMGAHAERHTKQIEEVKADPGFPKS